MVRGLRRAGRVAAVMAPFVLAACQSLIKSPSPCGDGTTTGDGCPHTVCDPKVLTKPTVYAAACDLDHLEKHIDWHGSVVAKVPDVWGQARLTLYREQFEQQMLKDLDQFEVSLQASVARQDQAFLLNATAISASLETPLRPYRTRILPAGRYLNGTVTNGLPANPQDKTNIIVLDKDYQTLVTPDDTKVNPAAKLPGLVVDKDGTTQTADNINVFVDRSGLKFQNQFLSQGKPLNLSLEPERVLEQKKRYLDLLAQIRRTNEGDDTADAPGYSLQLMRIPVSVLPGKQTDKGHGAEITMTITPVLGDDLLPATFRALVINDLVYQLGFPITQTLDPNRDPAQFEILKELLTAEVKAVVETVASVGDYLAWEGQTSASARRTVQNLSADEFNRLLAAIEDGGDVESFKLLRDGKSPKAVPLKVEAKGLRLDFLLANPSTKKMVEESKGPKTLGKGLSAGISAPSISFATGTESRTGLPTSQLVDVYGTAYSFEIALGARQAFEQTIRRQRYAHLPDVQAYLKEELNAAYDMLANPLNNELWNFCQPELVRYVRLQAFNKLDEERRRFRQKVAELAKSSPGNPLRTEPAQLSRSAALAWAIIVDAALLNDKLCKDMKAAATARGACIPGLAEWVPLYAPHPPLDACHTFNDYVRVRWPVHVFALDPAVQEQNLADRLATRRELQLALSLAFTHGFMSFNQLTRYARRLEAEYETIDLNRTQIGFAHGPDTFGWRFYPRFQTPDTPGNLTVIARDLLVGGPNKSQLLRERRLEPGPRECVALVIMPSFVPAVQLNTTSNFFGLANPKHKVFDHTQAVKLGRTVQAIKNVGCGLTDANCYRAGDTERLVKRAEQLEARLPMQTVTFPVPTEGTLGGFELFNTSTTSLSPELFGFYGAPGADTRKVTTLFLVGDHFSPLRTKVIIGNKPAAVTMLSRQVVQVDFGPDTIPLNAAHVTVHVGTPYGVSRELLVPVVNTTAAQPDGYYLTAESKAAFDYVITEKEKKFTVALSAPANQKVAVQGVFASGVVPSKAKLTLSLGADSMSSEALAVDQYGNYALDGQKLKDLLETLLAKRFPANTTYENEQLITQRFPQIIDVKLQPDTPPGVAATVYGTLRVTFTRRTTMPAAVAAPPRATTAAADGKTEPKADAKEEAAPEPKPAAKVASTEGYTFSADALTLAYCKSPLGADNKYRLGMMELPAGAALKINWNDALGVAPQMISKLTFNFEFDGCPFSIALGGNVLERNKGYELTAEQLKELQTELLRYFNRFNAYTKETDPLAKGLKVTAVKLTPVDPNRAVSTATVSGDLTIKFTCEVCRPGAEVPLAQPQVTPPSATPPKANPFSAAVPPPPAPVVTPLPATTPPKAIPIPTQIPLPLPPAPLVPKQ